MKKEDWVKKILGRIAPENDGGDNETRTRDLCVANASLSQLSYTPVSQDTKTLPRKSNYSIFFGFVKTNTKEKNK